MIQPSLLSLYLIADPDHARGNLVEVVGQAIEGGVSMVQLRAKSLPDRIHLALAISLRRLCAERGLPFLVNDRLDIALASGADGVHLGVDDLPVDAARQLGGPGFIIGFSPETEYQLLHAAERGADYLGVGPVYSTGTKADAGQALGIQELARRCRTSPLPVVGIGGIDSGNAAGVMAAGARGVAVVSAIVSAPDARKAARELLAQVNTTAR